MKLLPIHILLFILFFIWLHLFVFMKSRKGKLLILNMVPVLLITFTLFFEVYGINLHFSQEITYGGLILFPYTFAYLVLDYFPVDRRKYLLRLLTLLIPLLPLLVFFKDRAFMVLSLFHLSVYISLLIRIKGKMLVRFYITILVLMPMVYLIADIIISEKPRTFIISVIITYIFTYLIILMDFARKLQVISSRLASIINQNRLLNQRITRLRQSKEQLKNIIEQKDLELLQISRHASLAEITTGIAHELTQPLTGIKGISQNMIDDINYDELDNEQAVSDLTRISALVDRSSSIIDHIRTFSRKRGYSFQPVDINVCILNALELINIQLKKNGIDIVFVLDDTIPKVHGDNLSLEQLFINLIMNAKDAILSENEHHTGRDGIIKITTTYDKDTVELKIEDNGSGIPQHLIPKIWTPFFTTKQKGKGTGIGLSLSHRIIKKHDADVTINSSSEGTAFILKFPIEKRGAEAGENREEENLYE